MSFLKKNKGIIITALVAFAIGSISGSSGITQEDLDKVNNELTTTKSELDKSNETIKTLESKVAEAKPFFDMAETEKEAMKIEADKKAEENRKEQERIENEKKQAELEARTVTLGNGTYLVGKDIPEGVYDLFAVKGGGNVMSNGQVNVIMGVEGDDTFYQREQQNVALKNDTTIELRRVTVKFVPDDDYVIAN